MDGVFSLSEAARTDFLRALVLQFSGCAYICLWRYDSCLTNRLFFLDGFYNVNNQPSSSLGSNNVAERIFNQYQSLTFDVNVDCVPGLAFRNHSTLTFDVNVDCVPGLAFRNHHPYLELQQLDLLRLVSTEIQVQFFQEARIKTAVFMGCSKGEIELGFSNMSQVDIEEALRGLFPEDFCRQPQRINYYQNPHSSSSSYFTSSSTGSPECSSLLLNNIPGTSMSHFPETLGVMVPKMQPMSAIEARPHQQAIQALGQVIPSHFLTPEGEHDAIIRAMIHVISSSSTSHQQHRVPQQSLPYTSSVVHPVATTAFKKYSANHKDPNPNIRSNPPRQSKLKRSFAFSRSLNSLRMRERIQEAARFTSTQLQHMISERRRREKLNENFQALRALLPPKTKKDKASILTAAKETLRSLTAEIEKFNIRNQQLTTFLSAKEANASNFSNERLNIRVSNVPQSSLYEERMVDLQVTVRGESSQVDISIRLLEFFKRFQNVSLISVDANTHVTEATTINQLTFRIRIIEESAWDWDEYAFQEAVRRLVGDLLH